MKLHLKLLLCFALVSVVLPLIAYISILNPKIRHAAQFVDESHQEILSEHRLLIQLQVIDRCLQEIEIEGLRLRGDHLQHQETSRGQRALSTGELYSTLAAFKEQYSTFKRVQGKQWKSLSDLERLSAPDESEIQERALLANVAETLPSLERNIGSYMDLIAKSPAGASELLERTLEVQLRQQLLPSIGTAAEATERRMDEETQTIELILDRAYKQTLAAVVTSILLSFVLAVVISQSVAKPIRKLRDAAPAIGWRRSRRKGEPRQHR